MTNLDTAKAVLAKASLTDQTFAKPDIGIAVAWAEILGDINRDDALHVVAEHYGNETRRIMPADVLAGVRRIQANRVRANFEDFPELDAVADDPIAYQRVLREQRARVASGEIPPPVQRSNVTRAEAVAALAKGTLARLPRVPKLEAS